MRDEAPAPGIARTALGLISDADARELIREHDALIWFVIRRHFRAYLSGGKRSGDALVSEDDMLAVGRVAVLRAWVHWDPTRGAWSTIATLCIQRAIARAMGVHRRGADRAVPVDPALFTEPQDCYQQVRAREILERTRQEPEDAVEHLAQEQQLRWLRRQLETDGVLTPRQRQIVTAVLATETYSDAAELVGGITRQGIQMQVKEALTKLRKAAQSAELL